METDPHRIRTLKESGKNSGNIVYWMSRDQRAADNWALYYAYELAKSRSKSLFVIFVTQDSFLGTHPRNIEFMNEGLNEVSNRLWKTGIPFYILRGSHKEAVGKFLADTNSDTLITDFSPLKIKATWIEEISTLDATIYEVDAHNLIPVWEASNKQEFAARTIRKKLLNRVDEFNQLPTSNLTQELPQVELDYKKQFAAVPSTLKYKSGEKAAQKMLDEFISQKLANYAEKRNDPNENVVSNLSPYLHFGQLYIGRIIAELGSRYEKHIGDFIDEVLVRRELSDNYCFYNKNYDSFEGLPAWGKKTLNEHRNDKREFVYTLSQFEKAQTHDNAWNSAQTELLSTGKTHGYMRMYWAKKILEWSNSPEEAIDIAIYLNDKYSIDGRDPNGYVGVLWSIGGLHDRPWFERRVYGMVRYMNDSGLKRKFDVEKYIKRVNSAALASLIQ